MSEPQKPKRPAHRPAFLKGGKRRNIYIADADFEKLKKLGGGNSSAGLRKALEGV